MLTEIATAIILSICTTALLYIISNLFIKKWKIFHPKNTLFISLIVLLTAFSIIPFASIAFSTMDASSVPNIDLSPQRGTAISPSTILTTDKNITYSSSIKPIDSPVINQQTGITRYMQKITWSELIIYDEYDSTIPNYDSSITRPLDPSQFFKKTLIAINNGEMDTPELINQIITNILINQKSNEQPITSLITDQNDKPSSIDGALFTSQTLFISAMTLLSFISVLYVLTSIYLGKIHTLKRLNAKVCTDERILHLTRSLAKEFNIKPPKIYQFHGPPNAFVFGHPAVLVFSTQLKLYLTDKEFEAALRHELAHIKHPDNLLKPVLHGLRIFFFYNPFVHVLCGKIVKNMEILADNQTFSSKKEKISLMEALIKISEYSPTSLTCPVPSYQIALISYHSEKLSLTERFQYLFDATSKKTIITLLVAGIIILTNLSLFFVAGEIFESNKNTISTGEKQEFSIEETYYSESIHYTKIERNAKTYLAMIVQKNLYNVIETKSSSSQLIDDIMQQFFPDEHLFTVPPLSSESY